MPIMIGFNEQRRRLLQQELARMLENLPQLGIEKAILVGPMAEGDVDSSSSIELVIVQETNASFAARANFFYSHLEPRVGLQAYVYTPEEFEEIGTNDSPISRALQRGIVVYDG